MFKSLFLFESKKLHRKIVITIGTTLMANVRLPIEIAFYFWYTWDNGSLIRGVTKNVARSYVSTKKIFRLYHSATHTSTVLKFDIVCVNQVSHYRENVSTLTATVLMNANYIEGARILGIFPMTAKSHFQSNEAVMSSLVAAGHDVTLITAFPNLVSGKNYTIIDSSQETFIYIGQTTWHHFVKSSTYELDVAASGVEKPYCKKVLELKEVQNMLNSKEKLYDIIFVELFMTYNCYLYLAEKMQIPVIGIVTLRTWIFADRAISNPFNPSYLHLEQLQLLNFDSFFDRLQNTWDVIQSDLFWQFNMKPFLRNFHEENKHALAPYSAYLTMQPSLIFYNSHFTYTPRPMTPNAIEIAGIHLQDEKPLPQNFQKFIDEAEHGVVLFSLGSLIRTDTLEPEKLNAFVEAFAEIPQRVIWKLESTLKNISPNVLIVSWIPQRDILAHKNVKVFMSHCGQGGFNEAVISGTPIIGIPLFGDQRANSVTVKKLNIGVNLDIYTISKATVLHALRTVLNGEYLQNAQTLSERFKDRPMTPQETVVYWTEYILRYNGAPHLQTAATKLNWFQYFLLDVIAFVLFVCAVFIYLTYRLSKFCFCYICKRIGICKTVAIEQNKKTE